MPTRVSRRFLWIPPIIPPACIDCPEMARFIIAFFALISSSLQPAFSPGCLADVKSPAIHPHVFSLITCWPSDRGEPVVTEINLDAVELNRNQFPPENVVLRTPWHEYSLDDGGGFERYRIVSSRQGCITAEFQHNRGGTFTSVSTVQFRISTRVLQQQGRAVCCRVLQVLSIQAGTAGP